MPKAVKQPITASNAKPKKVLVIKAEAEMPTVTAKEATKRSLVIALLKRDGGATLEDLMNATGWQRHSVHGVLSGTIKKRLGFKVTREKDSRGSVYRISA